MLNLAWFVFIHHIRLLSGRYSTLRLLAWNESKRNPKFQRKPKIFWLTVRKNISYSKQNGSKYQPIYRRVTSDGNIWSCHIPHIPALDRPVITTRYNLTGASKNCWSDRSTIECIIKCNWAERIEGSLKGFLHVKELH